MYQLENFEENIRKIKSGEQGDSGLIDPNTKLKCTLEPNPENKCVDIIFETDHQSVIKGVIMTAENIFKDECCMFYAKDPSSVLRVPLRPEKEAHVTVDMQILVGYKLS